MPPTETELNVELKGIEDGLHRLELSTTERIGEVKSTIASLAMRVNMVIAIASVLLVSTTALGIKGLMDSAYWAGSMNTSIKGLETKYDERFKQVDARLDRMDTRFDRVDARLDRLEAKFDKMEAMLAKIIEQTRGLSDAPKPKPADR